jgi:BirA family biotin operon repressor/biotin-[acetyl-CoA-carboxylase] ligase
MILFQKSAQERLQNSFPQYTIVFHDCLDSSNLECERQWKVNPLKQWLILADGQTSGQGRHGRIWQSEPNINIYLSFVFSNPFARYIGHLNLFWGVMVYETISSLYGDFGSRLTLKWPNDLYIGDRKLAGILLQSLDPGLEHVVVGIGINVYAPSTKIPPTATSLFLEMGSSLRREARLDILLCLLNRLCQESDHPMQFPIILEKFWQFASLTRAHSYLYSSSQYKYEGFLHNLHEDGTVAIRTQAGEIVGLSS